ncbi:hypothetical protein ACROYT_G032870 [Oculina patagonica]
MPLSEARKKERKIAENRAELGVCLIAKRLRGPYRAVFSGCVVKSLFPNWRRKFCIITSGKIDLTEQYYLLCFRELDSELALIKVKLENVFCSESNVEYLSGLAIIPLDDSKLTNFFIKSSILTYRPFTVNKEESLDGSVCYIVDGYPDVFAVKAYDLEYLNGEYILKLPERGEQDATFKTFSELTAQGSNNLHPDGAVILKNVDNTLMAVGALAFVDDKISPVAFSQLQEFPVAITNSTVSVPKFDLKPAKKCLDQAKEEEIQWVENSSRLLKKADLKRGDPIAWAAYHVSQLPLHTYEALCALLPLFYEKSATPPMIKHGMNVSRQAIQFLNPGQVPVPTFDQPLFAPAKLIQWQFMATDG